MKKLIEAVGVVLLVCVGVRVGAALIQPVVPLLGGVVAVAIIAWWLFGRHRPGRGYR
ncbi:hypothetical protein SAMN02745225_01626 [Ferrithrix thermotolerans DSM 19514]|uniref:Uncharacterized protein n=1 Tax=Ferrithrix thermotolerans DSM 19514 TaxID=1121881 RepID=A0A1M4WCC7_9ACTN|nr:hypothetical protein SAMN02745225_01626 [Ferrithrix thermotolerans DSM 19514]